MPMPRSWRIPPLPPTSGPLPTREACYYSLHIGHPEVKEQGMEGIYAARATITLIAEFAMAHQTIPLVAAKLGDAPRRHDGTVSYGVELLFYRDCEKRQTMGHVVAQHVVKHQSLLTQIDEIPGALPMKDWRPNNCDSRYSDCSK